eukprot:CAMPEP_0114552126 /NCGR_PEP_ID=MMETSP0114-20121206/6962_1 /TAXON_ID=31324 /ORGANISM="Goniomonas sp, Strain m" /LENGTH=930 /DNA_ID=CAMNT_0001736989 /DNA_START=8 /DNA_END=2800 /DNA_ORIENTATION=-
MLRISAAWWGVLLTLTLVTAREYRTYDGKGNNKANPMWGAVGDSYLFHQSRSFYADGASSPSGPTRPGPRSISNEIFAETPFILNEHQVSDALVYWGQWIVHDFCATPTTSEQMNIPIPTCDKDFDPACTGTKTIPFSRSNFKMEGGKRHILNQITAYIDASVVYGETEQKAKALRSFSSGLMKTSAGNLLPKNENSGFSMAGRDASAQSELFFCGDHRCNVSPATISHHTLFLREHNRKAAELAKEFPDWDDETLFQEARVWVIALIQKITFYDYLPHRIGKPLTKYSGYKSDVNVQVDNFFLTNSMRYGHTALNTLIYRVDEDRFPVREGHLLLRDSFFQPTHILSGGIDSVWRGLALQREGRVDTRMIEDLRTKHPPWMDLAAVDIQRARDHGIGSYNDVRAYLGLTRVASFDELDSLPATNAKLKAVYGNNIDNLDAFVGGGAEKPQGSSLLGPLYTASLYEQFTRFRDGDRFYFEAPGVMRTTADLEAVLKTSLSEIVKRNTAIKEMPVNIFVPSSVKGTASANADSSCAASTLSDLSCMSQVNSQVSIHWTVAEGGATVAFALQVAGAGWLALGLSEGGMVGSEVALGSTADMKVKPFKLKAKAVSEVVEDTAQRISAASLVMEGGMTTLRFTREANNGGQVPLNLAGTTLVWAFSTSPGLGYHGQDRGVVEWTPGGAGAFAKVDPWKVVHGAMMFLSWGVLLPAGVFAARYAKHRPPVSGPKAWWFTTHVTLQVSAMCIACASWIIALVKFAPFDTVHGILGCIVMCLGICQLCLGLFRPGHGSSFRPTWEHIHRCNGLCALLLAIAVIYMGAVRFDELVPGSNLTLAGGLSYATFLVLCCLAARVNERVRESSSSVLPVRGSKFTSNGSSSHTNGKAKKDDDLDAVSPIRASTLPPLDPVPSAVLVTDMQRSIHESTFGSSS